MIVLTIFFANISILHHTLGHRSAWDVTKLLPHFKSASQICIILCMLSFLVNKFAFINIAFRGDKYHYFSLLHYHCNDISSSARPCIYLRYTASNDRYLSSSSAHPSSDHSATLPRFFPHDWYVSIVVLFFRKILWINTCEKLRSKTVQDKSWKDSW